MTSYTEPELTVVVLDFNKPYETALCLRSISDHVKVPHRVVYYHNGLTTDYPYELFQQEHVDLFMQSRVNNGLGVGTRDAISVVFTPYTLMMQNDQFFTADFTVELFDEAKSLLNHPYNKIRSVSLAGNTCNGKYSERAHLVKTDFYRTMEHELPLPLNGAGPYHGTGPWREEIIQKHYANAGYIHKVDFTQIVADFGVFARRQNPDGSQWCHRADTKQCWLIAGPVTERNDAYPKFNDSEWAGVLEGRYVPNGEVPESERNQSFTAWDIPPEKVAAYIDLQRKMAAAMKRS